ncbi:MAG: phosphate ABC transporter permease subunit PstC [Phycisphaerales bacterium]
MPEPISTTPKAVRLPSAIDPRRAERARAAAAVRSKVAAVVLFLAAAFSIVVTIAIVATLVVESIAFFEHMIQIKNPDLAGAGLWARIGAGGSALVEFATGTQWSPQFENPKFGILPLISGTLVTTAVALLVAIPIGTISAIWLSEYCPHKLREIVKPALELLTAVPTVVFGYFALLFVTPLLQKLNPDLPGANMLSAGLVMGIMIVPFIASLSEDAMKAVPGHLREGAYALGATRVQVAWKVVYPAAFSGITAAYILAVARALGETMIVAIAAGMEAKFTADPREPAQTLTAFIVSVSGGDLEHESIGYQSIFAAGLTLVLMTLSFNIIGHRLRRRYREAY